MRNLIVHVLVILSGCYCCQSFATTTEYLEAIDQASRQNYEQAIPRLRALAENLSDDDPAYQVRVSAWLALTLVAQGDTAGDAQQYLEPVVCSALDTADLEALFYFCDTSVPVPTNSQYEYDMVTAVVVAAGSVAWQRGEYEIAIRHYELAMNRAMAEPRTSDATAAELARYQQQAEGIQSPDAQLENLAIQQQLAQEMLKQKLLAGGIPASGSNPLEDNPAALQQIQQIAIQQAMAKQVINSECQKQSIAKAMEEKLTALNLPEEQRRELQKKLAPLTAAAENADCDAQLTSRATTKKNASLARIAAGETKSFYRLADRGMCQYVNAPDVKSYQDLNQFMQQTFAGMVEADRGNLLRSYEMTQTGVLQALNAYLDAGEQVRNQELTLISRINDDGSQKFLKTLSHCTERLQLSNRFGESLLIALARRSLTREHLEELVNTYIRLEQINEYGKSNGMMIARAYHELGRFYLSGNLLAEAQEALSKAIAELDKPGLFLHPLQQQVMGVTAINILRSYAQLAAKNKADKAPVYAAFEQLSQQYFKAMEKEEHRANLTPAEREADQMAQAKEIGSRELGNMQSLLGGSDLAGMLPPEMQQKMGQMLNQIQTDMQSGKHDSDIQNLMEKLSEANAENGMTLRQQDALGSSIENRYAQKNATRLFELASANLMLDMGDARQARYWLNRETVPVAWWHGRTQGFDAYTRARLSKTQNKPRDAQKYYAVAIDAWFSYPYSVLDQLGAPFFEDDELLQEAAALALSVQDYAGAFNAFELARHTTWDSPRLYGYLSSAQLQTFENAVKKQHKDVLAEAQARATASGETTQFAAALAASQKAQQASSRGALNPVLPLYDSLDALQPWLPEASVLALLGNMDRYIKLHAMRDLKKYRKEYLVAQSGSAPEHSSSGQSIGNTSGGVKNLSNVQALLPEDTVLITAWMEPGSTHLFGVTRDAVHYQSRETAELLSLIDALAQSSLLGGTEGDTAKLLYQAMIAPFNRSSVKRLIISSNGPLQMVPFAALVNPKTNAWLNDERLVSRLPSASDLLPASAKKLDLNNHMLVVDASAVPGQLVLASAESEVATVKELFNAEYLGGESVTKAKLASALSNYNGVHFAGHSKLNTDFPDLSRLYLYDAPFYVMDIRELDLSPLKLVVLSSCESAANTTSDLNNEFSALHASFLEAGVDTTVATLNIVKDNVSSEFTRYFYNRLKAGDTIEQAIQKARKHLRDSGYVDVRDWAAFVLNGRGV